MTITTSINISIIKENVATQATLNLQADKDIIKALESEYQLENANAHHIFERLVIAYVDIAIGEHKDFDKIRIAKIETWEWIEDENDIGHRIHDTIKGFDVYKRHIGF